MNVVNKIRNKQLKKNNKKIDNKKVELLAPAGNMSKLKTAFYFGADAVYLAGKRWGLRTASDNFTDDELKLAIDYAHDRNKKVYVVINVLARARDFDGLKDYLIYLSTIKPDGLIIADLGVMAWAKKYAPKIDIHISTQANVTNVYTAKSYIELGAKRIIPARELDLKEIKELRQGLGNDVEIETFVHGAMCMSYSGRCILSNHISGRPSNSGACSQNCRYEYVVVAEKQKGTELEIVEDERGTYIFNSRDLNMIEHVDDLIDAGVGSFKIEGRVKSEYYVGCVVNAYRLAIDDYYKGQQFRKEIKQELDKAGSRDSSTGLYYDSTGKGSICSTTSKPINSYDFVAICVVSHNGEYCVVEMRNRFMVGDCLEIVSPTSLGVGITVSRITDKDGIDIQDVKNVQEWVRLYSQYQLHDGDLLRRAKDRTRDTCKLRNENN